MAKPLVALVHEDDDQLELLERLLEAEGYRTVSYNPGSGVHEMLADDSPNIVLLDLSLDRPGAGWALLESLRLDPQTTRVPVVLCCADPGFIDRKRGLLEARYCILLEKPYSLPELLAAIRTALLEA